ncbi:BlaI/MecI/CopY family transcriptional regulator [Domibacillus enclensis]|uniref:Transcriptional regulator n=1 Tax=Domibacillus enclensis TaxID=1017273 RepID=A0A1N6XQS8_9BACI|nr:BlaI/MecI/CopY family transcriptional regulator [Domibacillus enclensis]OXS77404.1 transcriptional regulator [Domibacillus enclensis]SIR04688.1 Predicted transcriptional regulator [Domibacillus enclensis]
MKIQLFKRNERGLNRFFGPLEAKIMDVLWQGERSIKDVQHELEKEKSTNFNTVMTVMNRLVDKGILIKRTEGRASIFSPVQSREEFVNTQSKEMTQELMDEFGSVVVSHMIEALDEADEALVAQLEQKIKDWKKEPSS